MKKKDKGRKKTIYYGMEGYREVYLVKHCKLNYFKQKTKTKISFEEVNFAGSTPASMLIKVLREVHNRDECYLIIDNDTPLSKNASRNDVNEIIRKLKKVWRLDPKTKIDNNISLKELASLNVSNRSPFIIPMEPINTDGLIIQLLDEELPQLSPKHNSKKDKEKLKAKCDLLMGIAKTMDKKAQENETLKFFASKLPLGKLNRNLTNYPCLKQIADIFNRF